ncbi:MAG: hypothetical protein U9Q15_03090 [Patescibacteria group bacterium]|nr:hypothetical protein [Patescibacteria group bacterium]
MRKEVVSTIDPRKALVYSSGSFLGSQDTNSLSLSGSSLLLDTFSGSYILSGSWVSIPAYQPIYSSFSSGYVLGTIPTDTQLRMILDHQDTADQILCVFDTITDSCNISSLTDSWNWNITLEMETSDPSKTPQIDAVVLMYYPTHQ